jgi:hypothetical protein
MVNGVGERVRDVLGRDVWESMSERVVEEVFQPLGAPESHYLL